MLVWQDVKYFTRFAGGDVAGNLPFTDGWRLTSLSLDSLSLDSLLLDILVSSNEVSVCRRFRVVERGAALSTREQTHGNSGKDGSPANLALVSVKSEVK